MASTSQKKTTGKKSGTSGSRTAARKPQPRPIRREVGGVVCLILALCVFVSYFGISAIFIDALAMLAKGLIGYGYWVLGPALVLTAFILLFHHGRPVTLRVISAMLLPVLAGQPRSYAAGERGLCLVYRDYPGTLEGRNCPAMRRRSVRRTGAGICSGIF